MPELEARQMDRITNADLDGVLRRIEWIHGNDPSAPIWRGEDGRNVATVGRFYIDGAYGGVALYRMESDGGAVSDVLGLGHVAKRDLYNGMHAFIRGMGDRLRLNGASVSG